MFSKYVYSTVISIIDCNQKKNYYLSMVLCFNLLLEGKYFVSFTDASIDVSHRISFCFVGVLDSATLMTVNSLLVVVLVVVFILVFLRNIYGILFVFFERIRYSVFSKRIRYLFS